MVRHTLEFTPIYQEGSLEGLKVIINDKGDICLIDEEDLHLLEEKRWRYKSPKQHYVVRGQSINMKYKLFYLHREVMFQHGFHIPSKHQIDHINRCKFDNRKRNLRIVSRSQNQANRSRKQKKGGFKGVTFNKRTGLYEARIHFDNKYRFLGSYPTAKMAAHYYNQAAKQIHGEHANLNQLD